jgi:predicted RNA methylase
MLLKRASDVWHEAWTVEKAREYYDNRGQQIHLHETEDDARKFAEEHGGSILKVILDSLEVKRNSENLYIERRIPADHVRRIA